MIKLTLGGSPCTHWSIAQTKNRETEPSGLGWELFKNYLIGLEKYNPTYFLYENNKSMAPAIREQITKELGVEPILINSALVSAQNRQRLYWTNIPGVTQPEDKGILLRDVLESGVVWNEKSYCLTTRCQGAIPKNTIERRQHQMVAEPVNMTADGKAQCLRATCYKDGIRNMVGNTVDRKTCVAEPVRVCNINGGGQGNRIYSADGKSFAIKAQSGGLGGHGQGLYAVPCMRVREATKLGYTDINPGECVDLTMANSTTRRGRNMQDKSNCLTTSHEFCQCLGTIDRPAYEVRNGLITIKGKQYPIKLVDGYYIIRKLTVTECKRLQTVPDSYIFPVSDSQAYKMLGNSWTVEVIKHILSFIPNLADSSVKALSMYDGMAAGMLALRGLGVNINSYHASEIDKYCIKTVNANFPEIIQIGDAFNARSDAWEGIVW